MQTLLLELASPGISGSLVETHIMERKMNVELYKAAKEGKPEFLRGTGTTREDFLSKTHQGNNIFHIAARQGHKSFIEEALLQYSNLFDQKNSKGDSPLHVAARFGHLQVVKLLVNHYKSLHDPQRRQDRVVGTDATSTHGRETEEEGLVEEVLPPLWRLTNLEGTTALHEALRNGKEDVSLYLLEEDPDMACCVNGAGESPLYLAAESRCEEVMKEILNSNFPFSVEGPHGQNPLHAAKYCTESSITLLLEKRPELAKQGDDRGKTALHYAVEGHISWLITFLLEKDPSVACVLDADGLTPLLRASSIGDWRACGVIVNLCPESIEACNVNGQNAVHLFKGLTFLAGRKFLKIPEIMELINERDHDGNTPLHLAIKGHNYKMARLLVRTKNVDLRAINKKGLTALDMCESDCKLAYKQRRMWFHLKLYKAPHGRHPNQSNVPLGGPKTVYTQPTPDWKEMANTLSLVAILLATVTFAAAFTMPGGFNSGGGDNPGVAVLIKKAALQVFVLSDTFAMFSSITVVFFLIWAMIGEPELLRALTSTSLKLIKYALYATLVAFATGIYTVTAPEAQWVAILVCIMGSIVPFVLNRQEVMGIATGIWPTSYKDLPPAGKWNRKRKRTARMILDHQ